MTEYHKEEYLYVFNNLYNYLYTVKNVQKVVIDWKHHVMRYEILQYLWMCNIINNNTCDISGHFLEKLRDAKTRKIKTFTNKQFWNELNIIKKMKHRNEYEFIPVIKYKKPIYNKYIEILEIIITNIQYKIEKKLKKNKIPKLCPLEIIVLQYMIKIIDKGKFSELTCLHLYDIIDYFYVGFDDSSHAEYNCKCTIKNKIFDSRTLKAMLLKLYNMFHKFY